MQMLIWIIWFIVIVAVVVTKYYTVSSASKMKMKLNGLHHHLARAEADDKAAKDSLEVASRTLQEQKRKITAHDDLLDNLRQQLKSIIEAQETEREELRKKLSQEE